MDAKHTEHAEGDHGHGIHLPDPSIWPIVAGVAALILGFALVWWSENRDSDLAGPLLGVGATAVLFAAGGWALEDGRMKKKAEEGTLNSPRDARFTQVITFALPDGGFDAARAHDGVLSALEGTNLKDHEGFQDLRIIASPAASGPSQVILETTWSGREGLAGYEGTRQSLLDTINRYESQLLPGTLQVFDMQVVRDTKDMSFNFGLGAAVTTIAALLIGGFAVGAGLTMFEHEGTAAADGGEVTPVPVGNPLAIVATDNKWDKTTLTAAPNADVKIRFDNKGKAKHNLHILDAKGGKTLAPGAEGALVDGGQGYDLVFKTPGAGTYFFLCDVHPDQMTGTFEVKEGAPTGNEPPGGGAAAPGAGSGAPALVGTDNKFDKASLSVPNGAVTIRFDNKGKAKHNLHILDKKGGKTLAEGAEGAIIDGGQGYDLKFTTPGPGSYFFLCDVHPDQMTGTLTVT
ncbi:MAG: cupredoxin domain-containing protein [Dehalococcoidia bacterium]